MNNVDFIFVSFPGVKQYYFRSKLIQSIQSFLSTPLPQEAANVQESPSASVGVSHSKPFAYLLEAMTPEAVVLCRKDLKQKTLQDPKTSFSRIRLGEWYPHQIQASGSQVLIDFHRIWETGSVLLRSCKGHGSAS